jgi:2-oxoglutarate ferredoxin oxidoreductase subunit beta
VTGDGDALSIGGNHFIHLLRRNLDVNVLLFNNQIYGLTKGQYSPTSEEGKITKSTPMGSVDHPFNPAALCLGADATFVARSLDRDPKHLQQVIRSGYDHKGTSLIEIYQNCNVFNDGAFEIFTEKATKKLETIFVTQGKPLVFGENGEKGIILDGFRPKVVEIGSSYSLDDLWIHDEQDQVKASILTRFFDHADKEDRLPRPFGVFYQTNRPTYEEGMAAQLEYAYEKFGKGDLDKLLAGKETWTIQ